MSSSEAHYIIVMDLVIHLLSLRIIFMAGSVARHLRGTEPQ